MTLATALFYLGALAAVGTLAARRRRPGLTDYLLAGRGLSLPGFVATLVPSFYGGALGIGELVWTGGVSTWLLMGLPYYLFAALYAFFLAGRVRLEPGLTIPDHLRRAYGPATAAIGALLIFVLASPADELLMLGTILSHATGLPRLPAMALCAAAVPLILARGGLRSDVWTNGLQMLLMYSGFSVLVAAALRAAPLGATLASLPPAHLDWSGGLPPLKILGWWLIAAWTLVDPGFHQRCAAAESPEAARRGILISIGFWALFDLMTMLAGLSARALEPALAQPALAFPALAQRLLGPGARAFFYLALCSSTLAALQSTSLIAAMSLGKDLLGREHERATRLGLGAALLGGLALASWLPSVAGLWYAVGSAAIPGLLLPLLGVYFPRLRARPRAAALASGLGSCVSIAWLLVQQQTGAAPLGLEPMFPGLTACGLIWLADQKA